MPLCPQTMAPARSVHLHQIPNMYVILVTLHVNGYSCVFNKQHTGAERWWQTHQVQGAQTQAALLEAYINSTFQNHKQIADVAEFSSLASNEVTLIHACIGHMTCRSDLQIRHGGQTCSLTASEAWGPLTSSAPSAPPAAPLLVEEAPPPSPSAAAPAICCPVSRHSPPCATHTVLAWLKTIPAVRHVQRQTMRRHALMNPPRHDRCECTAVAEVLSCCSLAMHCREECWQSTGRCIGKGMRLAAHAPS